MNLSSHKLHLSNKHYLKAEEYRKSTLWYKIFLFNSNTLVFSCNAIYSKIVSYATLCSPAIKVLNLITTELSNLN
jgi:hypothetical protein